MGKLASDWKKTYDFALLAHAKARPDKGQQADEFMGAEKMSAPLPWKGELGKVLEAVEKAKDKPATLKSVKELAAKWIGDYRNDINRLKEDLGGTGSDAYKLLVHGLNEAEKGLGGFTAQEAFTWEVGLRDLWKAAKKKSETAYDKDIKEAKKGDPKLAKAKQYGVDKYPAKFEKLDLGPSLEEVDGYADKKQIDKAKAAAGKVKNAIKAYDPVIKEAEKNLKLAGLSDATVKPLREALDKIETAVKNAGVFG
jgi:hypothetical protein